MRFRLVTAIFVALLSLSTTAYAVDVECMVGGDLCATTCDSETVDECSSPFLSSDLGAPVTVKPSFVVTVLAPQQVYRETSCRPLPKPEATPPPSAHFRRPFPPRSPPL